MNSTENKTQASAAEVNTIYEWIFTLLQIC